MFLLTCLDWYEIQNLTTASRHARQTDHIGYLSRPFATEDRTTTHEALQKLFDQIGTVSLDESQLMHVQGKTGIPGLRLHRGYACSCKNYCTTSNEAMQRHLKHCSSVEGSSTEERVKASAAVLQKLPSINKYFLIDISSIIDENESERNTGDSDALRNQFLKCTLDTIYPTNKEVESRASLMDDVLTSPFYSISNLDHWVDVCNSTVLKQLHTYVTLKPAREKNSFDLAVEITSKVYLQEVNEKLKGSINAHLLMKIQNSDRGFASDISENDDFTSSTTDVSGGTNRFTRRFFRRLAKESSVQAYARTVERFLTLLLRCAKELDKGVMDDAIPQLDTLMPHLECLRSKLTAIAVLIGDGKSLPDNSTTQDAKKETAKCIQKLVYTAMSIKFKETASYSESIFQFFTFAVHLTEKDGVIRFGRISALSKIAAHLLFALKGCVLLTLCDRDSSDYDDTDDDPLGWLACSRATTLTSFNFTVNLLKVALTYSSTEKSDVHKVQYLIGDNGLPDPRRMQIGGNILTVEQFQAGTQKLIQTLQEKIVETLCGFKPPGDFLDLLHDDYNVEVDKVYTVAFVYCFKNIYESM